MLTIPPNGGHLAQATVAATRPSPTTGQMQTPQSTADAMQSALTTESAPPPPPATANRISGADAQALLEGVIASGNESDAASKTNGLSQRVIADAQTGYGGASVMNAALSQVK